MNEAVVVDASVVFKWMVSEPFSDLAISKLLQWRITGIRILAPSLLAFEIANALYRRVFRHELTMEIAENALAEMLIEGPELDFDEVVPLRAMQIAQHFNRPSVYDAHYLALAEREGCEFWTADERLWNTVRRDFSWVRWVGETDGVSGGA